MDHPSAEAFGRLAVELHDVEGVEETVDAVVQFAVRAVDCDHAAVVLVAGQQPPEIMALTDATIVALYQSQIDAGTGPLINALQDAQPLLIKDVRSETRWPRTWVEQAVAAGVRSALHLPLLAEDRAFAVLSLFSSRPDAFSADDIAVAHILARHASVAIASALQVESLASAVDARKLVGQAMGILMERYGLDSDRAFEVLKRYSQTTNRKLRDVAQDLIDTRRLPGAGEELSRTSSS